MAQATKTAMKTAEDTVVYSFLFLLNSLLKSFKEKRPAHFSCLTWLLTKISTRLKRAEYTNNFPNQQDNFMLQ
jgi:hypothetical protein